MMQVRLSSSSGVYTGTVNRNRSYVHHRLISDIRFPFAQVVAEEAATLTATITNVM